MQTKTKRNPTVWVLTQSEVIRLLVATALINLLIGSGIMFYIMSERKTVPCSVSLISRAQDYGITLLDECQIGWRDAEKL